LLCQKKCVHGKMLCPSYSYFFDGFKIDTAI